MLCCRGNQGIHIAAEHGHLSLVTILVSLGCPLSSPGQYGNTVLHSAAGHAQLGVVQYCIGQGVGVDSVNNKLETPLHLAAGFFSRGYYPLHSAELLSSKSQCRVIFIY